MTWKELMRIWQHEYHAICAATVADLQQFGVSANMPLSTTFYDFLTTRTTRFHLSAHGVGRDIEA